MDYCGSLLIDRFSEVDDRQAAACSQCCSPNRLQHSQVRSTANWRWTSTTGFGSGSVSRCTSVCKTWRLDTCRLSANPCPAFLLSCASARLIVVNWSYPRINLSTYGVERLPTPVLQLETHFLTISERLIFRYQLSNVILEPYSSLVASTHSVSLRCSPKTRCISK